MWDLLEQIICLVSTSGSSKLWYKFPHRAIVWIERDNTCKLLSVVTDTRSLLNENTSSFSPFPLSPLKNVYLKLFAGCQVCIWSDDGYCGIHISSPSLWNIIDLKNIFQVGKWSLSRWNTIYLLIIYRDQCKYWVKK